MCVNIIQQRFLTILKVYYSKLPKNFAHPKFHVSLFNDKNHVMALQPYTCTVCIATNLGIKS